MNWRLIGVVVTLAGLALLVLSVFADPLGIGGTDEFGNRQILGTVVGAAALGAGLVLVYRPRRGDVEPGAEK